jgi:predicted transposase/invertase (TIGR01784 family)
MVDVRWGNLEKIGIMSPEYSVNESILEKIMSKRLVRFDWAMKKLLRNKANFSILEGFFSELLHRDIKIQNILDSESNKQSDDDKYNRVDLLALAEDGELMLIELQVEGQFDYFHRMLYGTSKLITDYMVSGSKYREVRKVISINIVYFDLGQGIDYIYKGQTEFKGIHKNDLLKLSAIQQKNLPNLDHVAEIFPEYYILKVNDFDNHAIDTLDEWIYVLKNSEVPDGFSAKGLKKASKELDLMKLSETDRKSYERYIDDCRSAESSIETSWLEGHEKGIGKGIEKGIEKGKVEVARRLIAKGMSVEDAAEIAGVSAEDLRSGA